MKFLQAMLPGSAAWSAVTTAAAINFLGMILGMGIQKNAPGVPFWPPMASSAIGLLILIYMLWRRKNPSARLAGVLFVFNALSVAGALVITDFSYAVSPIHWAPFQAGKLGCLIAAMLAPGFWPGFLAVGIHTGGPVLNYLLFSPETRANLAFGEPLASIAWGFVGFMILCFRMQKAVVEQKYLRARIKMEAAREVAKATLRVRDLMNTPLQSIELGLTLIMKNEVPLDQLRGPVEGSIDKLRRLSTMLASQELDDVETEN